METQAQSVGRMYDPRAATYEDSWHPAYSARVLARAGVRPGDRVLVLCCGTGLEVFLAADAGAAVVVGVDASPGMLGVAEARRREREEEKERKAGRDGGGGGGGGGGDDAEIHFLRHDVTDLDACADPALRGRRGTFDLLVCVCALVLLGDPAAAVRAWRPWLRADGGRVVVDVPHERNLPQGRLVERAAESVSLRWPSARRWIRGIDSPRAALEAAGLQVLTAELLDNVTGFPRTYHDVGEGDAQFERISRHRVPDSFWPEGTREKAREVFLRDWEEESRDGKVPIVDGMYLYIAKVK